MRAARIDTTQNAIVDGLLARGYKLQRLQQQGGGVPDILCLTPRGNWRLLEVKSPEGKLTPAQEKWMAYYGPVPVVETLDQALEALEGW